MGHYRSQRDPSSVNAQFFSQIHSGVQVLHLIGVAIEGQRARRPEQRRQPRLARLAPVGMIDRRIHVGVEP
jgi:hypothetical protein